MANGFPSPNPCNLPATYFDDLDRGQWRTDFDSHKSATQPVSDEMLQCALCGLPIQRVTTVQPQNGKAYSSLGIASEAYVIIFVPWLRIGRAVNLWLGQGDGASNKGQYELKAQISPDTSFAALKQQNAAGMDFTCCGGDW